MLRRNFFETILRSADAGAGDPASPPPPPPPPGSYRPDGLPDHLAGASDRETIDRLYGAYRPLREEQSRRVVPKAPDEYAFAPGEKLQPYFSKPDDPALAAARTAALKHGMTKEQFQGFIGDVFTPLVESGAIGPAYNPQAELTTLSQLLGQTDKVAISAAAEEATSTAEAMFARMKFIDGIPDEVKASVKGTILGLADTAGGAFLLKAIKGELMEKGIQLGGLPAAVNGLDKAGLKAMDNDPRIDPDSPKFDPQLRAKYDEAYKRLFPGMG